MINSRFKCKDLYHLTLALSGLLVSLLFASLSQARDDTSSQAENLYECEKDQFWTPTDTQLQTILKAHVRWVGGDYLSHFTDRDSMTLTEPISATLISKGTDSPQPPKRSF